MPRALCLSDIDVGFPLGPVPIGLRRTDACSLHAWLATWSSIAAEHAETLVSVVSPREDNDGQTTLNDSR